MGKGGDQARDQKHGVQCAVASRGVASSDSFLLPSLEFWQPGIRTQVKGSECLLWRTWPKRKASQYHWLEFYQLKGQVVADYSV